MVKAGFAHKRKKVASNLKKPHPFTPLLNKERGWGEVLKRLGNKRAEELTLFDWIEIAKMI